MGSEQSGVPTCIRPPQMRVTRTRRPTRTDSLPLELTVDALYSHPPLFSNLRGAGSTVVQTSRTTQCVPGQAQDSCTARVTVNILTPTLNRGRRSKHRHIRCFPSLAPAQVAPCGPMPVVTSVNQMAVYQVFSHPASECLLGHVLHGICPNVMALGSQRRAVAF